METRSYSFGKQEDSPNHPTFYDQRQTIIQILKDLMNDYQKGKQSYDPERPPPQIPEDEVSDGHWNLASQALKDDQYTRSAKKVWAGLQTMKEKAPRFYAPLANMFLRADFGHGDYEHLRVAARHRAFAAADWGRLQKALDLLTHLLRNEDLHARFPARVLTTTHRRQTMEENYAEIARVYSSWCADLSQRHHHFKRKALLNTAEQLGVAKSTVERALKFAQAQALREAPTPTLEREHRPGCQKQSSCKPSMKTRTSPGKKTSSSSREPTTP